MEKVLKLNNETGMHTRPAGIFVKLATSFTSKIEIQINDQKVNAKSIMSLLSLGLENDAEFTLIANGPDEGKAIEALSALVQNKFEVNQ